MASGKKPGRQKERRASVSAIFHKANIFKRASWGMSMELYIGMISEIEREREREKESFWVKKKKCKTHAVRSKICLGTYRRLDRKFHFFNVCILDKIIVSRQFNIKYQ